MGKMMKGSFERGIYTEYERNTNSIYIKVHPTSTTRSGIGMSKSVTNNNVASNLAIFDIAKDKLVHFFDKDDKRVLISFLYEKSYDEENKKMIFNNHAGCIVNNVDLEKREAADKLFVFIQNTDSKIYELWMSSRLGENRKLVKSYKERIDWKIDVYNRKIFFFEKLKNEVRVEMFDW